LLAVLGFAFDIGNQALGRQVSENPLLIDFDNIDFMNDGDSASIRFTG
jgi:hypothetical protein